MNNKPYCVHVIVDPLYGARLRDLPSDEPAWVVDSETNHPIIEAIWKGRTTSNHLEGLTSFKYDPKGNPESWFLNELQTIDLHHGDYSHDPPYSALNVIGIDCSETLERVLKEYGFTKYKQTAEGFMTLK